MDEQTTEQLRSELEAERALREGLEAELAKVERERDAKLGAAVRAAVEHVEGDLAGHYTTTTISLDPRTAGDETTSIEIGLTQLDVLRAIDAVLRSEEGEAADV